MLPATLSAAVLVVLHRPSNRISYLRDVLARRSRLPVVIAKEGESFTRVLAISANLRRTSPWQSAVTYI
jgi:chemotaxis response regulator CheB